MFENKTLKEVIEFIETNFDEELEYIVEENIKNTIVGWEIITKEK